MLSSLAYIQCCPDLLDLSANATEKRKGRVRENAAAATLFGGNFSQNDGQNFDGRSH